MIVTARDGGTVASKMWDLLFGTQWPGVAVRALRNDFTLRWAGREGELVTSLLEARAEFDEAHAQSDHKRIELLAGEGSARIDAVLPAAKIVRMVVEDAEAALRKAAGVLV